MTPRDLETQPERVADVANAIARFVRARADRPDHALLGMLLFLSTWIALIHEDTDVTIPHQLLTVKAALDDFLAQCGMEMTYG